MSSRLNGDMPEPVVERFGDEEGRLWDRPWGPGDFGEGHTLDAVGVVGGQCVADRESGIVADDGEPLVTEHVHQRDQIVGEGAGVVPASRGLSVNPMPRWSRRDDLEVPGQRRHHQAPCVPVLRPAVHQQ